MTYQPKIETDGTVTHLGARIGEVTLDNPRRDASKISCNWMRSDVDQDEFREMESELERHRFYEPPACPECAAAPDMALALAGSAAHLKKVQEAAEEFLNSETIAAKGDLLTRLMALVIGDELREVQSANAAALATLQAPAPSKDNPARTGD